MAYQFAAVGSDRNRVWLAAKFARRRGTVMVSEMLETRRFLSVSYTTTDYADFNSSNGPDPNGPLVYRMDGNLFGVSTNGGDDGGIGTMFEIPFPGGVVQTLVKSGDVFGATPVGGLISDGSNFFGVSQAGGQPGAGSVFEIVGGTTYNMLASFSGTGIESQTNPAGPVVDVNGNIFGIAKNGGANSGGEVFEVAQNSGVITDLAPFAASADPAAGLVTDASGNIYGLVNAGVFKVVGNAITMVATFNTAAGIDGGFGAGNLEGAPLVDSNGTLFGCDSGGVFEVVAGSQTITQLGTSAGLSGQPDSPLIIDSSGDLFGTTTKGVFEWVASSKSFTMIASLPSNANGLPDGVAFGGGGDIFVTDGGGGAAGDGAIYELSPIGGGGGGGVGTGSGGGGGTSGGITPGVSSSTVTGAVVGGAKLHDNLKVSLDNTLNTTQSGFAVKVYASTDTTLDTTTDTLVTSLAKSPTVKPGRTAKVTVPITQLPSTLDGTYYLIVQTTDSASNTASVAAGSTVEVAPPFVKLTETLTSTLAAALVSGTTAKGTVTLTITNSGNVASKGATPIDITASTISGVLGTTITTVSKTLHILPGKSTKVVVPIKSIPALADNNYFIVAQMADPFAAGMSVASSAGTIDIAAPFILLSGTLGPASLKTGDFLTVTNHGNIADTAATLTGTLGFSMDAAGAVPAGSTVSGTVRSPKIAVGKSGKIHLTAWSTILSSLTSGVPYYLTVTFDNGSGGTVLAVSTTTFTLS